MIVIVCEGQNVKAVMSQPVFSDWRQRACLARTTQPQRGRMRLKGLQSEVKTKTRSFGGQIGVEMRAREGVQGW
jgi:hypothetical protein